MMNNTLVKDNFEEISKLNERDREIVIDYFNTWSETQPCYFIDGLTIKERFDRYFLKWIEGNHLGQNDYDKVIEYVENDMTLIESHEYDVDIIVAVYNQETTDNCDLDNMCEELLQYAFEQIG
jgi:hypothetical protein